MEDSGLTLLDSTKNNNIQLEAPVNCFAYAEAQGNQNLKTVANPFLGAICKYQQDKINLDYVLT